MAGAISQLLGQQTMQANTLGGNNNQDGTGPGRKKKKSTNGNTTAQNKGPMAPTLRETVTVDGRELTPIESVVNPKEDIGAKLWKGF